MREELQDEILTLLRHKPAPDGWTTLNLSVAMGVKIEDVYRATKLLLLKDYIIGDEMSSPSVTNYQHSIKGIKLNNKGKDFISQTSFVQEKAKGNSGDIKWSG
jgi:hypothetical protein